MDEEIAESCAAQPAGTCGIIGANGRLIEIEFEYFSASR